jgi:hypothetical protein
MLRSKKMRNLFIDLASNTLNLLIIIGIFVAIIG